MGGWVQGLGFKGWGEQVGVNRLGLGLGLGLDGPGYEGREGDEGDGAGVEGHLEGVEAARLARHQPARDRHLERVRFRVGFPWSG